MKILSTFLIFSLLSFPLNAQTPIEKDEPAPSEGVFLTKDEAATILVNKKISDALCEANTKYEKEKVTSICSLEKQNLEINLEAQKKKYDEIIEIKDKEAERLYEQVKENSVNYNGYFFAGGIVVGALVTAISCVAIFFAATQTDKAPSLIGLQ